MGDSEDEYDRKRRDKFRGERSGGGLGSRDDRSRRDDWPDRESWSSRSRRSEYRDYRSGPGLGGSRYSPVREPPSKRIRSDWGGLDDRRYGLAHDGYGSYGWAHDTYGHHPAHQTYSALPHTSSRETNATAGTASESQPAMMSFKSFLSTQDDSITDEDAIKKYNDYKLEFRRQQLNEFFIAHKDEEWFKIKYHPEESLKRKEEQRASLKNRLDVFIDLFEDDSFEDVSADAERSDRLIRLLDTVVIKLEGGTEEDLKILDEKPEPPMSENDKAIEIIDDKVENIKKEKEDSDDESKKDDDKKEEKDDKDAASAVDPEEDDHPKEIPEKTKEESNATDNTNERKVFSSGNGTKRKRSRNSGDSSGSSSGSSSSSSSSSDSSDSENETGTNRRSGTCKDSEAPVENEDTEMKKQKSMDDEDSNVDNEQTEKKDKVDVQHKDSDVIKEKNRDLLKKTEELEKKDTRVALHKTTSIFLRNLSPSITKAEVEAMCRRYGGFLRVALADPLPDRRWFRRGWVSFKREVNIKDICWNLNNIRLKDCELGAIVNRDLSRRIRPVNGITLHKQIIRTDARLAAKLCYHLDAKAGLWDTKVINTQSDTFNQFNLQSSNPVLHNITEYLIEEASAEEEELLGLNSNGNGEVSTNADGTENASSTETVERDPQLTKVLDRLILYLRIVHSLDYYNHCEYPYEDEMPNRCGIMHARGAPPSSKVTPNDISEYIRNFENKISSFLQEIPTLDEEELIKLGTKDPQGEVEKFIQANTQELAKDKWLCPLSGKKFKGPDFIRKHIFNKHAEKVEEVKKEVEYFNNYLKDVKRPQLQEQPVSSGRRTESAQPPPYPPSRGFYSSYHPAYGYPPPAYPPAPYSSSRHMRSYNRGRGPSSDFRPVIHYRDLDAPREPEDFV